MNSDSPIWQFCASFDRDRADALLLHSGFESVAVLLEQATVEFFSWESFSGPTLRGCHRAYFSLRLPKTAYDAFFNSPVGYRGQFARSVAKGDAANRQLLLQFAARLLAYAESHSPVTRVVIHQSLHATQAKLWIDEAEVGAQLGAEEPAIDYAPWVQASDCGVGLLAPIGTLLEVKGGWLTPTGEERLNPNKSKRSEDIHRTGFS